MVKIKIDNIAYKIQPGLQKDSFKRMQAYINMQRKGKYGVECTKNLSE
jgi:hypothetical protein